LIVPSENRTREFDAKLLLGCAAAEAGYRVIVGSRQAIHFSIDQLPRAIYLAKDLRASSARMFDILDKLGHAIVAWDEEALVYYTPEHYYAARLYPSAFRMTRALFAWGDDNADLWRRSSAYHGAPIYVAGNPRIDLLRPELLPFFAEETARLKQTYGDIILVNSNFASVNHYVPDGAELARTRISGDRALAFHDGAMDYRARLLEQFLTMVPALARAFPDATIVVRPHPSENQRLWQDRTADCNNVVVRHEGNIVPWLIAARAVVHNGCTTAIEAGLINKATIAYQPISSEAFDIHRPNQVSHRVSSIEELCGAIAGSWDKNVVPVDRALFDSYVAPRGNNLYAERIVGAIQELEKGGALEPRVGPYALLLGRIRAARRRKSKQKARGSAEHVMRYDAQRFQPLTIEEVQSAIQRLSRCLHRFERVQVTELKRDIFCLSAAPARETAA
jgi:surface carbohydrate biosynthesis protein